MRVTGGGPLDLRGGTSVDRLATAVLAIVAFVAGVWIMHEGRGLNFFYDEWDWLLKRREGLDGLLQPHNGHLSLVPLLVYKLLFATAGVEHYWVYRLVGVLSHLLCVGVFFALVRARLGAVVALAAATVLLWLGAAWQVLLWPFEISYMFSIAAGLGALLALERETRRADTVAAGLVLVSLASSGLGIAVVAGVVVELLVAPAQRIAQRAWVAVAPLTLYATWYMIVLPGSEAKRENAGAVPGYVADAAAGAVAAATGLGQGLGRLLLIALAIAVIVRLLAPGRPPGRLIAVVTIGLVYWGLLALARAQADDPVASRYVYFGAVIVLLIAVYATPRNVRLHIPVLLVLVLAVGMSLVSNLGDLREGSTGLHETTGRLRTALAAVELAGEAVPATTAPEPNAAPQISARAYLRLVEDRGSPIGGPAAVLDDGPASAVAVDVALARVLGVAAVSARAPIGGAPPRIRAVVAGRATVAGSCVRYLPARVGAALDLTFDAGSSIVLRDVTAPAQLRLRRMTEAFSPGPLAFVKKGAVVKVATPTDGNRRRWVLRVSPAGALRACSGSAG